jgi:hypothetical protein
MRVNVYKEERTGEVAFVKKEADTGAEYIGIRFYLHSAKELHHRPGDDDRSAVTFWGSSRKELLEFLSNAVDGLTNSR